MSTKTKPKSASLRFATQLFQDTVPCFMAPEVEKTFGITIRKDSIPPLPSQERLEMAHNCGLFLYLEVPKNRRQPLTMKSIYEQSENKLVGGGALLANAGWYIEDKQTFYEEPITLKPKWKFGYDSLISGTVGQNYIVQTRALVNFLQRDFLSRTILPDTYLEAIAEFEREEERLNGLLHADENAAALELTSLGMNQLFRPTIGQLTYLFTLFGARSAHFLQSAHAWTRSTAHNKTIIFAGAEPPRGVLVTKRSPKNPLPELGSTFVCDATPLHM